MANILTDQMIIGTLNRVFMAYFQNEAENFGVDFYNTRPTESITKSMIGNYFIPDVEYAHMRNFYIGRFDIRDVDIRKLRTCSIDEFLDEEIKNKLHALAKEFSYISEKYPFSDYIFSDLPEARPYISDQSTDCDTNFTARMIYGHELMTNSHAIVFEFYCLMVDRWRKIEDDPIYGQKLQVVSSMTDEERKKFDVQPKEKEDEDVLC